MRELTPPDVRGQGENFRRSLRGYDPKQVDAFLGAVADSLDSREKEATVLRERVAQQLQELESFQERERALNDALLAAQELRDEARRQSEREAEARRREVAGEVGAVIRDGEEAVRQCQEKIDELALARSTYLGSLRTILDKLQELQGNFDEYLEMDHARFSEATNDLSPLHDRLNEAGGPQPDAPPD